MFPRLFSILLLFVMATSLSGQQLIDSINQKDAEGRKQGSWIKYNDSNMLKYKGQFVDDIPVDTFVYYFPDGIVQARSVFSENGIFTETTIFHHNGKIMSEGFYRQKNKDSLWKYFDIESTLLKEEFYKNNQNEGVWKVYYDNGNVAEEVQWHLGKRNGIWKQYFQDGKVKIVGNFIDDEKQGEVSYYYTTGRTKISGQYDKSLRTGQWIFTDEKSKVTRIETYEEGKLIKTEDYGDKKNEDK